jgi:hypothetical protein
MVDGKVKLMIVDDYGRDLAAFELLIASGSNRKRRG